VEEIFSGRSSGITEFISYDEVLRRLYEKYFGPLDGPNRRAYLTEKYANFFTNILLEIEADGACEILRDAYATPFIRFNKSALISLDLPNDGKILEENYRKLGSAGDKWLGSAMVALAQKVSMDAINNFYSSTEADEISTSSEQLSDDSQTIDQSWEPLKIDREAEAYRAAIEATEKAIREIETSNGYASSEPDERNAIVAVTKGTLEAVKTGSPPLDTIKKGLLQPLGYIARKFSDSTIGEAAKVAFGFLVKWLFG
jgi:hypothetical protein